MFTIIGRVLLQLKFAGLARRFARQAGGGARFRHGQAELWCGGNGEHGMNASLTPDPIGREKNT